MSNENSETPIEKIMVSGNIVAWRKNLEKE